MNFVLHFHETTENHYDLMIEQGQELLSWRINDIEHLGDNRGVPCVRITNHRKEYLSYEGPVSGNRGTVRLYDSGLYTVLRWELNIIMLEMKGERISGILTITDPDSASGSCRLTPFEP
jgi:hypothetical protein